MKNRKLLSLLIALIMVLGIVPLMVLDISAEEAVTVTNGEYSLSLEKSEFKKGEPIFVTATGNSGNDWIGIGSAGTGKYTDYHYLGFAGEGVAFDVLQKATYEAGEYDIFLVPENKSYNVSNTMVKTTITITDEVYDGSFELSMMDIGDTDKLVTKNNQRVFKKGEPILISATGNSKDWIGFYDDVYDESYSSYRYVSDMGGSGIYYDITSYRTFAPGTHFIRLVADGSATPYEMFTIAGIYITVTDEEYVTPDEGGDSGESGDSGGGEVDTSVDFGDTSLIVLEKKEFAYGEPILVAANGSGTDWVGIYDNENDLIANKWHYISTAGTNVPYDILQGTTIAPGKYLIRFVPNNSGSLDDTLAGVWVTVLPVEATEDKTATTTATNGTHSLGVNKTVFDVGESIWVTSTGVSSTDWIGIALRDSTEASIRWYYVSAAGNGVPYDIKQAPDIGGNLSAYASIPEGLYTIYLIENDGYLKNGYALSINISVGDVSDPENGKTTVSGEASSTEKPSAPTNATYEISDSTSGFAFGTVTVTMPSNDISNRAIMMYWADASGKLEGYTALARFKVTGESTTFIFTDSMVIPNGATRLLVYSQSTLSGNLSEECISIDLPNGSDMKKQGTPNTSVWIISDIHIGRGDGTVSAENFKKMLNQAIELNPNGVAIFIVGDMADGGTESQYEQMISLHSQVMTENGKDVADYPLFLALGNHDYPAMSSIFLQYATLPDGTHPTDTSYDFWLDGYHYIFLGSDTSSGLYANLSEETLSWLDSKLTECRDVSRPTFVFLHQPMYNTVSGSLPGEGWHGVSNEEALRAILSKYPEVMLFNGHTHWTMDSSCNIFEGTEELPIHIFNCASVSYLWSGFNKVTGENLEGSQGYYVEIYNGKIFVRGRNFIAGEWISSAQYLVELTDGEGDGSVGSGHSYYEYSLTYENGYMNQGKLTYKCSGCEEIKEISVDPLFTCLGYSVQSYGTNGIAVGYTVNKSAISEYERITKNTLSYGFFAVRKDKLGSSEIFDENKVAANGVISSDLTSYGFVSFELKILNFADEHKNTELAMGAYVKVTEGESTKYSYLQATSPSEGEKYSFTTYNKVVGIES